MELQALRLLGAASSPPGPLAARCPWRVVLKAHWRRTSTRDSRAGLPAGRAGGGRFVAGSANMFPYASFVPGCESSVRPASVPVGVDVTSKPRRQLGPDRDLFSGTASLIAWLPFPARRLLQGHCRAQSNRVTQLSAGPARAWISVRHDRAAVSRAGFDAG